MAKLILKQQEPPKGSWLNHYSSQIAYAGFIVLLLLISLGVLFAFKPNVVAPQQALPALNSATDAQVKAQYLSDWDKLVQMQATYEQLAKTASSQEQAQVLLNQAEMAWQHLLIMTESAEKLGLSKQQLQQLNAEQAYQQDQWQARIHFAELRVERFSEHLTIKTAPDSDTSTNNAESVSAQTVSNTLPNSKFIAQPPAGVELPAGFCTLNGSGICKPEANN